MKRAVAALVLLSSILPGAALALDTSTRLVSPIVEWTSAAAADVHPAWLHVKFVEGSNVTRDGDAFIDPSRDVTALNATLTASGAVELRRTFRGTRAELRALKAAGEARAGVVGPDLSLWYNVRVAGGADAVLAAVNALNELAIVEIAHPVAKVETATIHADMPAAAGATPDYTDLQDYLYAPPVGLDGPAAWLEAGGTGAGLKFIDVELAWTEEHEDFNLANLFYQAGVEDPNPAYEAHGTAVLGEVLGQHNGFGIDGFAPDVQYGRVAIGLQNYPLIPEYFQQAVDALDFGDVWLIELQTVTGPPPAPFPMEYYQVNFDVIWTGVFARGVMCVEAGANGSNDLDDPVYGGAFDRNLRDSGAILVAAGTPTGLVAEGFSNYGSRMDAHAWGSQIVTGYGDLQGGALTERYTSVFGGTSGASPMVVGAALCLQGISLAQIGHVQDPLTIRSLITATGTPQNGIKLIGPRPDLGAAVTELLATAALGPAAVAPAALSLVGAPNPFRAANAVEFTLPADGRVSIAVFDVAGRQVRTLLDGRVAAGARRVAWDGRDETGRAVGSGAYFYRLEIDGVTASARVLKVR